MTVANARRMQGGQNRPHHQRGVVSDLGLVPFAPSCLLALPRKLSHRCAVAPRCAHPKKELGPQSASRKACRPCAHPPRSHAVITGRDLTSQKQRSTARRWTKKRLSAAPNIASKPPAKQLQKVAESVPSARSRMTKVVPD